MNLFAIHWVLPDYNWLQVGQECLGVQAGAAPGRAKKRVSHDACVRLQLQESQLAPCRVRQDEAAIGGSRNVVPTEERQGQVGDSHGPTSGLVGPNGNPLNGGFRNSSLAGAEELN